MPDELVDAITIARGTPDSDAAWDAVDELARMTERPEEVSKVYLEVLARDLPKELIGSLGERAARFHEEWFEDPSHVIAVLRRVLTVDPSAEWAFERLSLLLTMAERWDDLLDEYDRALSTATDVELKKKLLDEAARIAKDFAGQTNRAIGYLKDLVPLRPEDGQLAQSLERRLVLQKRHRDLIDVWNARLPVLAQDEELATRIRIAETWLEKLNDAETALAVVLELLERPDAEDAACRLLEKIGVREAAPRASRRTALETLKNRFDQAGRGRDVVRVVELSLAVADGNEELIALRTEARDRLASDGDPAQAVGHGAELLVLSPLPAVRDRLRELVDLSQRFEPYRDALVRAAAATDNGVHAAEYIVEAGRVAEDRLQDAPRAIELYSRALSDPAAGDAAQLDVARRLTRLLAGDEHARERLAVLERRAELEPGAVERRSVLGEAASLAESLGDPDHALALWKKRLGDDPEDMQALDASAAILERHGRWESLVSMLQKRADANRSQPDERRRDLVTIAGVHQKKLEDIETAIEVWRGIQDEFGQNAETIDALANLSAAARRWTDVVGLLRAAADEEDDPERRVSQLARMGDVYREQRSSPARAVESYGEALAIEPRHEVARAGLIELLDHAEAGAEAAETLARAYATSDEWQGTLELVERRVDKAERDEQRRSVLLEGAQIYEERANDKSAALAFVRRAFALLQEPDVEGRLRRLAEETGDFKTAAAGYAEAISGCTDERRQRELLFEHGQLLENRLGDFEGALESFRRVVRSEPSNLMAACSVVRVGCLVGAWDAAARALVQSAKARQHVDADLVHAFGASATDWDRVTTAVDAALDTEDLPSEVAHDLLRQLAVWHRDRRDDPRAAEAAFSRAVAHVSNADTLRMLAELQRRSPGRKLVSTLLQLADATDDDADVLHEAASVSLLAVQDGALAAPILERLLHVASARWRSHEAGESSQEARLSLWALDQLVELASRDGNAGRALHLLIDGSELPCDPATSRALRFRAAQIASVSLGDSSRAIELANGILEEAPDDGSTISLLASLYAGDGLLEDLLALRRRELTLSPPVERRLELRLEIARVLGELGGDDASPRVEALRENLADSPGHPASVDAMAEVLDAESRHADLLDILWQQAKVVQEKGDLKTAAELWSRAGALAESPLRDVARALEAYRRSVELEPSLSVLDALARIHTGRGEHSIAVRWLEQRLARTGRGSEEVGPYRETVLRLAHAQRDAGNEDQARETLVRALEEDPGARKLRELLAALYREAEDYELLAPLLAEGVDHAPDVPAKIELLGQAAQVLRRRLNDVDGAIPLLERAVQLAPAEQASRLALADALRTATRFDEARKLLDGLLEEFGRRRTPERAQVHYHLARIARAQGDLDEALTQLERASSIERTDPHILRLLGDVAREKGELEAAERAYRALLLIVRRQQVSEDSDEVVAASEIIYELYRMAMAQGQNDRANDLLESAFEAAAENNVEALRLERVFRESGQTALVLRVLDTRLDRIEDPAATAEILCARAEILAATDRLDEALEGLLDALGRAPDSERLLKASQDLAVRAGSLERFVIKLAALAEEVQQRDADGSAALWMRAGGLAETEMDDTELAARFYGRALESGARAFRAYRALLRVVPEEDSAGRIAAARAFVSAPEDPRGDAAIRTDALYELAAIELADETTADEGVTHLEEALARETRHEAARMALAHGARNAPNNPRLIRLYERIAREMGEPPLLLEALSLSATLPDVSLDVLRDAMALAKELGDDARLGSLLERTVSVAETQQAIGEVVPAVIELAARKESEGDAARAVELLSKARAESAAGDAFELGLRIAELALGPAGDLELAARTYEDLLEREPAEIRVYRPLLETYRRLGKRDELETAIARIVEAVYDPDERNRLRMERGRILLDDASRLDEAEATLREVLDEDPDHVDASVVLSELLEKSGRFDELNELLEHQLSGAQERGDGEAVATLALRIGNNLEREGRIQDALELYKDSLEQAPSNRALLAALSRMLRPEDDPVERASIMDRLLRVTEGAEAADLAVELAEIHRTGGDERAAQEALELGYKACPDRADIRDTLVALYTSSRAFDSLAMLFVFDAEHRGDPAEAVRAYQEAASIYEEQLRDRGSAADVLARALRLTPDDVELLTRVVEAFIDAGRLAEALQVVSSAADETRIPVAIRAQLLARRAALRLDVGEVTLETLGEAVADLERANELSGDSYVQQTIDTLERQRQLAAERLDEETERSATMRLARALPAIGEQRRGLEILVGWVKRKPDDADAVRGLGQFAANAQKWAAAAKAFQRLVEVTHGEEQVEAVVQLAEACERAGNPMEARGALEAVYQREPESRVLRAQLRKMYEAAGAFQELAALMMAEAENASDDDTRYRRLIEAGDLSRRVDGGERTAVAAYQRALALRPDDHHATIRLADTLAVSGAIEEAANILDVAINGHNKRRSPELSELQYCMARVGKIAEDYEAVFAWLDAALQSDRQNGAAAAELAVIAMQQGDHDTAIRALQAVTLLKEPGPMSRAEAYLRQGMIAEEKGDRKKAVFLARRALTTDPDYGEAKQFLEQIGEA